MAGRTRGDARTSRGGDVLLGRETLVDELIDATRRAARGNGALFVLTAEAGMGKTSVARSVAAQVLDEVEVSWSNCTTDLSAPPFWPWRGLVNVDIHGPPAGEEADRAIGAERYNLLNGLRDELLARRHARLLVIEDLQWADVSSVLLLHHVASAVVTTPMLIVATLRTGEPLGARLRAAVDELSGVATTRDLPPLSVDSIEALMRRVSPTPDPGLAALVAHRTGGNPLFVTELIATARTARSQTALRDVIEGSVPTRVADSIARRLSRLPDQVSHAVGIASVVGTRGDTRTLALALGLSADKVLELLDQARAARLLGASPPGAWQFEHDLVRDAVYESLSESERVSAHAIVLEAFAANPATPAGVLAHHAVCAQPLFDAERAVALAAAAGEAAHAHHAYEEAVVWFERALANTPAAISPRWRAELLVRCGEAHRHIGNVSVARSAFLDASRITDDSTILARSALGYADPGADLGIAYRTEDSTVAALLERAISAQPVDDSLTTVLLESRLAAELYFSDVPHRARSLSDVACARARRLGSTRALGAAGAVAHDAFVVGQAPMPEQLLNSQQLLDWAREDGSTAALLSAHRARVFDLLAAADLPAVDAEILAFRRIAEPLRAPAYLWWLSTWSTMRTLLEGRLDDAETEAIATYELGKGPLDGLAITNLSFLLFFLRREQGRLDEMESATRSYAADQADVPAIRVALTFLLAETGKLEEARVLLSAITAGGFEQLRDRNWPATWFQLARAAALLGDATSARALLASSTRPTEQCVMVSLATVCLGSTSLAAAWLLHAIGDLDAADAEFRIAEDVNARLGARSWLAQTRADHARLLLDRAGPGDLDHARRLTGLAAVSAAGGLRSIEPTVADLQQRLAGDVDTPADSTPRTRSDRVFRRDGAVWHVAFNDRVATVPHARGMNDLRALLARPHEPVSVMELAVDGGIPHQARGPEAFDERARREIRARLRELESAIAEAEDAGNTERAALIREQRRELAEMVARDLGLGGRSRRIDDPIERARKTVSTRIRRTIASVNDIHPELGRHLQRSIDTGAWCAYRPAEPFTWNT